MANTDSRWMTRSRFARSDKSVSVSDGESPHSFTRSSSSVARIALVSWPVPTQSVDAAWQQGAAGEQHPITIASQQLLTAWRVWHWDGAIAEAGRTEVATAALAVPTDEPVTRLVATSIKSEANVAMTMTSKRPKTSPSEGEHQRRHEKETDSPFDFLPGDSSDARAVRLFGSHRLTPSCPTLRVSHRIGKRQDARRVNPPSCREFNLGEKRQTPAVTRGCQRRRPRLRIVKRITMS